jgi:hypothetical protein
MYLAIPSQPDCAAAWLAAVKAVNSKPDHEAHNVIVDVQNPTLGNTRKNPIVALVDDFLLDREKSVACVANTIFPYSLYHRHGHPKFIEVFHKLVLPKVRKNQRWSGYYFERMTNFPMTKGPPVDQLSAIVERMNNPKNKSLNKYELSLFDPERDVDGSPYGGQCLSYLSFKRTAPNGTLHLTALYRNQYYIEKLLGNIIGLGRVMEFVAAQTKATVGALTIVSTHAEVDLPKPGTRADITALLAACEKAAVIK